MGKRYNQSSDSKYQQFDEDFEDYGYEVKNIRRQTKKKVTKFKREVDEYYDTYWTVHLIPHSSRLRVLYTCWRDFSLMTITERNQKLFELREQLIKARAQVAWIEQEIWLTNDRYKNQDLDLYKEMFSNWLTTMQFQVTNIEFDFEDSLYPLSEEECAEFYDDYVGTIWEADDGDDLVEEITSAAGYCVKSIDYRIILDDIEAPEHESTFEIDYTTQAWQLANRPPFPRNGRTPCL